MELNELDEVAVEEAGEQQWVVYEPLHPGSDRGEYWGVTTTEELVAAQREGLEVYNRQTGEQYDLD